MEHAKIPMASIKMGASYINSMGSLYNRYLQFTRFSNTLTRIT